MGQKARRVREQEKREKEDQMVYHCGVCFEEHRRGEREGVRCQRCGWLSHCEESFQRWKRCCRCLKPMGPTAWEMAWELIPFEDWLEQRRANRLLQREVIVVEERKWMVVWVFLAMLAVVCVNVALFKDGLKTSDHVIVPGPTRVAKWCDHAPTAPSVEGHWTGASVHGRG